MGQAKRGNRKSGSGMRWCRTVSMFHRHKVIDCINRLPIERDCTVRGRILIYASGKEALFFRRISSPSFRRYPEVTPELPVRIIGTRIHPPRDCGFFLIRKSPVRWVRAHQRQGCALKRDRDGRSLVPYRARRANGEWQSASRHIDSRSAGG